MSLCALTFGPYGTRFLPLRRSALALAVLQCLQSLQPCGSAIGQPSIGPLNCFTANILTTHFLVTDAAATLEIIGQPLRQRSQGPHRKVTPPRYSTRTDLITLSPGRL